MKKIFFLLSALIVIGGFAQVNAQKVGYVNSDSVLRSMPEYKVTMQQYQSYANQLQKQLKSQETELQDKYQKFLQEQNDLIPEILQKRQQELQRLQADLQKFAQESEVNLARKEQQLMMPLNKKIQDAITAVAQEQGYDMITERQLFLFSSPEFEITNLVIDKVTGAAAGTSPEATPNGN